MAGKMVHVDRMMIVSSIETKANEIISRIRSAGVAAQQYLSAKGGRFSQAILSGQTEAFLKRLTLHRIFGKSYNKTDEEKL